MNLIAEAPRLNANDYFKQIPESNLPTELIQGEIITMPAPSDEHQYIVTVLAAILVPIIQIPQLGQVRVAPTDVRFDFQNVLQPDIFVVLEDNPNCSRDEDRRWRGAPDLCVEIISPSSAKRDLQTKFDLYEQHGVREYWIIHPESRIIQQYHRQGEHLQRHAVLNAEDTLTSAILPQLTFPLASIFEG